MRTTARLQAIEAVADDFAASPPCATCNAPRNHSGMITIDAHKDIGGVCSSCRRVLDTEGKPFGGMHAPPLMLLVSDPAAELPAIERAEGEAFTSRGDGGPAVFDTDHLIVLTRGH